MGAFGPDSGANRRILFLLKYRHYTQNPAQQGREANLCKRLITSTCFLKGENTLRRAWLLRRNFGEARLGHSPIERPGR